MARAAKHRHVAASGNVRGEEARARIIAAALRLFGKRGFDGASTRDIAADAGANAPALQYYFGNKEGVYLACVEHIVKRVWESMSGVIDDAERKVAENADDDALIETYCEIQVQLCRFMFTSEEAEDGRWFMARLQSGEGPPAGLQLIYQHISERMSIVLSTIVGRLLGLPAEDEETLARSAMLTGQLHVFHVSQHSVLTKLNWDRIDERRLNLLVRLVRENTATLLRAMVKSRDSSDTGYALHGKRAALRIKKKVAAGRH